MKKIDWTVELAVLVAVDTTEFPLNEDLLARDLAIKSVARKIMEVK